MYNTNYFNRQGYYVPMYQQPNQQVLFNDVRLVNDKDLAEYVGAIGSRALLINNETHTATVVTTDNMGNIYKEPYTFNKIEQQLKTENKQDNLNNFATKEDIYQILAEFKAILQQNKANTSNLSTETKKPF